MYAFSNYNSTDGRPDGGSREPSQWPRPPQDRRAVTRSWRQRCHPGRIDGTSSRLPPDRWNIEPVRPTPATGPAGRWGMR